MTLEGQKTAATVAVYLITFQRPRLLERALASLLRQTESRWLCHVVNDDPCDFTVQGITASFADDRIALYQPAVHRGAAENFNLAFREAHCPFASILEDDNWWEPTFLERMLAALRNHPELEIACGNETIWEEQSNGTWRNTGCTVWPQLSGEALWTTPFNSACGSAKLCNSSMMFRTVNSSLGCG